MTSRAAVGEYRAYKDASGVITFVPIHSSDEGSQLDDTHLSKKRTAFAPAAAPSEPIETPKPNVDYSMYTCWCDLPCKVTPIKKEGPNKGHYFFGCSKPFTTKGQPDGNCGFYLPFEQREEKYSEKKSGAKKAKIEDSIL
jgi:hypothetical protein